MLSTKKRHVSGGPEAKGDRDIISEMEVFMVLIDRMWFSFTHYIIELKAATITQINCALTNFFRFQSYSRPNFFLNWRYLILWLEWDVSQHFSRRLPPIYPYEWMMGNTTVLQLHYATNFSLRLLIFLIQVITFFL